MPRSHPLPAPSRAITPLAVIRRWLQDRPLRRIFRNAGVLLGGKAVAGLLGLGALALTARGLAPEAFGVLILVHSYVRLVGGLVRFQSWQAVIRYGARCLEEDRAADLQRLLKFTGLLDLAGAAVGAALAAALAPWVADWMGWDAAVVPLAALYALSLIAGVKATPTGILRLFDRFDVLAAQSALGPLVRVVGAALAFAMDGGIGAFLAAWAASALADGASLVVLAWRELGRRTIAGASVQAGLFSRHRGLVAPHPGLWRFVWTANLNSALGTVGEHLPTLIVGWLLGPAPAGLYKIAGRFAHALATPSGLLRRSVYPELAKLAAQDNAHAVRRIVIRAGALAGGLAVAVVAVLAMAGEPLLALTVGEAYVKAFPVLLLLALATAIWVFGFALEPAFYAIGRPDLLLRISVVMTVVHPLLLIGFLRWLGLEGAGVVAVLGALAWIAIMSALIVRYWRPRAA